MTNKSFGRRRGRPDTYARVRRAIRQRAARKLTGRPGRDFVRAAKTAVANRFDQQVDHKEKAA